jgi:response regulator RpfG family c-di-GMP phosphodiesterase
MIEKILLVDDDPGVLDGYKRLLHREFQIDTALGGKQALQVLEHGSYAVVVSDMRMPQMDGIQLLIKIKGQFPDVVRVMLTGNADIETAVNAVNEGNIFRFLTKPCGKELMGKTLTAALMQYRLVTAEKELLEHTLSGSIQVLTDVLSLVNPAAFGRAIRLRRYVHHVATRLALSNPWRLEIAAMMSQLGCVTLPPETIEAVYSGQALSPEDQAQYDAHPKVAHDLLSKIPRLEPIAWMVEHQNQPAPIEGDIANREMADMRLGSEILRLALAFDKLINEGVSRSEAAHRLSRQHKNFSPQFFQALVELDPNAEEIEVRRVPIEQLSPGMIVQLEVCTDAGALVVSRGQEVSLPLILKLKNFYAKGKIDGMVSVSESGAKTQVAGAS